MSLVIFKDNCKLDFKGLAQDLIPDAGPFFISPIFLTGISTQHITERTTSDMTNDNKCRRNDMRKFPCTIMRGGTSKAIFFLEENMPEDRNKWSDFLLDVMGSPDKRQIDGLGGANSLTSKVAIIGKSKREGIDVDYTFAQVSLDDNKVAFNSNCGNISSAVGPFALEKGLVSSQEPVTRVRIFNTNTDKLIESEISAENGTYQPDGECLIPGVPNPGSEQYLAFYNPEGAVTGKLLPTGNPIDKIETSIGPIEISIVDAASPLVFINAEDLGLEGTELHYEFTQDKLELLEEIRSIAAELCGFSSREEATAKTPAVPKTTVISRPKDYRDVNGEVYKREDMDLLVRMMSMQKPHQALAITGAVCSTVAAMTEATLVSRITGEMSKGQLKLGHPGGIMKTSFGRNDEGNLYTKVIRTARRIMDGQVYTRNDY